MRTAITLRACIAALLLAALAIPAAAHGTAGDAPARPWFGIHLAIAAAFLLVALAFDARSHRIPNELVLAGAVAGLGLHALRTLTGELLGFPPAALALNAALAAGLAVVLWSRNAIPAGDAKLIMAAAVLVPIDGFSHDIVPAAFPFALPLLLAFLLPALAGVPRALARARTLPLPRPGRLAASAGGYSLFFLAFLLLSRIGGPQLGIWAVVGAIGLSELLELPFKRARWFHPAVLATLGIGAFSLGIMHSFLAGLASALLVRTARESLRELHATDQRRLSIQEVRPGMLVPGGASDGLSAAEINRLRRAGVHSIRIARDVPFAPWLAAACLLVFLLSWGIDSGIIGAWT
jgi:Flp pilus assembly protein protease CpaA